MANWFGKNIDPDEMREDLLKDLKVPELYESPEYMDCDCCGEKEEITKIETTHDGYQLCQWCVENECHKCDECGALFDNEWDYCPVCGRLRQ